MNELYQGDLSDEEFESSLMFHEMMGPQDGTQQAVGGFGESLIMSDDDFAEANTSPKSNPGESEESPGESSDIEASERNTKSVWGGKKKKPKSDTSFVEDKPWRKSISVDKKPFFKYMRTFANTPQNSASPRRNRRSIGGFETAQSSWRSSVASNESSITRKEVEESSNLLPKEEYDDDVASNNSSESSGSFSYSSVDSSDEEGVGPDIVLDVQDYSASAEDSPEFWSSLPFLPNHFVDENAASNPTLLQYLDVQLTKPGWHHNSQHYVLGHRMFLRALFQLLAERDQVGVEDSINHADNIIKKGPLKKKLLGMWRAKYVELRKGNLVYYGDGDGEGRKTLHLRRTTATCTPHGAQQSEVSDNDPPNAIQNSGAANSLASAPGFGFDVWVEGKRFSWLASSDNERQSWIRAIRQAMIGERGDDDWGITSLMLDYPDAYISHQEALESYRTIQLHSRMATTQKTYLEAFQDFIDTDSSLEVPIKWVQEQYRKANIPKVEKKLTPQERLQVSIAQFWRDLSSYDFAINGRTITRISSAPELIVGTLSRCILDFDRSSSHSGMAVNDGDESSNICSPTAARSSQAISELQAVSYARNILVTLLRSKTSGDVEFAVEHLCENEDVVVKEMLLPLSLQTLHIDISFAGDDVVNHDEDAFREVSGWIKVRRSKYNSWKSRFCVFSEGVFSYFEHATPRPHGLRGQLALSNANLGVVEDEKVREDLDLHVLQLSTTNFERERQFGFESREELLEWQQSIQQAIDASTVIASQVSQMTLDDETGRHRSSKKSGRGIIQGGTKFIKDATDGGRKVIKGATDGGLKVIKGATGSGVKAMKGASNVMFGMLRMPKTHRNRGGLKRSPSLQVLMNSTRASHTGRREPTVQCVVQGASAFKVVPINAAENAEEEAWITIRVKFLQAYLLSGGPSGRIAKGDAVVDMEFMEGSRSYES